MRAIIEGGEHMKCKVGDWIAFEKGDVIIIAEVVYREHVPGDCETTLFTAMGTAIEAQVLERRAKL